MNQKEIGLFIATARKQHHLTQKELADMLFVTDKAVSKWERGLSSPDSSILSKLAFILNCEVDDLVDAVHNKSWIGVLDLNEIEKEVNIKTTINNMPLTIFLLGYFALVSIKDVTIFYSDNDYIDSLDLKQYGFNLLNSSGSEKKFLINNAYFLYGSSLTKMFQNCMNSNQNISLCLEEVEIGLFFDNYKFENIVKTHDKKNIWRGIISIPIKNSNLIDIESLIAIYQKYSRQRIMDLNEIILNRNK